MTAPRTIRVALVGNPNAGKSTLFNALSGLRQHIGNYPGVTIEMKTGRFSHANHDIEIIDLPGTYSLAPRSPDEVVAVDLLLGRWPAEPRPDLILSVVDASNLERHLYLTTQLLELGLPVVLAVNMVDVAENQGIRIDCVALEMSAGLRVIPIQANRGIGLDVLRQAIVDTAGSQPTFRGPEFPEAFRNEVARLHEELPAIPLFLIRRLILDIQGSTEQWLVGQHGESLQRHVVEARLRLAAAGAAIPAVEARTRFAWIRQLTATVVSKPATRVTTWTDRIDRVLTHKLWGTLIFVAVMFLVFQSIFVGAEPLMEWIDQGTSWTAQHVEGLLDPGPLRSLLADGIITGVGNVIKFLPQILILFGFIAILEDCGYMARAAFLMDRIMSRCGLSGKSFIPMLSSVACAVPGIMATRVIENRRDRIATILVAPLMSCSARLPVYTLLIGTFLTEGFAWWVPGLTLFGMYAIGFLIAPLVAIVLKRTLLRGAPPLFVMELPAYQKPSLRTIFRRMYDAGMAFLQRAGTMILASMILIWALLYFPDRDNAGRYEERIATLQAVGQDQDATVLRGEWKRASYLGRIGRTLEPIFEPLGWDWRIGMSALASFPAREVIVGTLAIVYNVGDQDNEESLRQSIQGEWQTHPVLGKYPVPVALSVMVFFALCCQCVSTLAVIRRETRSWSWPIFTFVYMTTLAYLAAFVTFQLGRVIVDRM